MYEYDFALELAKEAGKIISENFRTALSSVEWKGKADLVTNVDKYIDGLVRERILKAFPSYGIVTEEADELNSTAHKRFIIDPLDGTTNFVKSYPQVAVSIAFENDGKITFGVVYNPILEELFIGEIGKGATLNGKPISVTKTDNLESALIATGFVYKARNEKMVKSFNDILGNILSIRCDGSAALDLAHVAQGIFDGYYQKGIHIWDIAAGSLIVQEAKGRVSDFSNGDEYLSKGEIFASNGLIHDSIIKYLNI